MLSDSRLKRNVKKNANKPKKTTHTGGADMHVTYDNQKFICTPEPQNSDVGDTVENLKNLLESNQAAEPKMIDETNPDVADDVTPDSEQSGGARKRKKSIKKKKIEKKKKTVKSTKVAKKVPKTRKGLYKDYLDKKYNKEQLMKICKRIGVKITVRKNGNVKPIKKETLIKKITALKFNK